MTNINAVTYEMEYILQPFVVFLLVCILVFAILLDLLAHALVIMSDRCEEYREAIMRIKTKIELLALKVENF